MITKMQATQLKRMISRAMQSYAYRVTHDDAEFNRMQVQLGERPTTNEQIRESADRAHDALFSYIDALVTP